MTKIIDEINTSLASGQSSGISALQLRATLVDMLVGGLPGTVNVEAFYPPGYASPHNGSSHPLSSVFGSLTAAQTVYPFVDDLTPETDWCAIQSAIDYAFRNNFSDILIPTGNYELSEALYADSANSLRAQGSALPGDYPPISPCGPRWTPTATFTLNQIVLYNGVPYISLQNGNIGHAPRYMATESYGGSTGPDPWWRPYYATAATSGNAAALSTFTNWKFTLRGEKGQQSAQLNYGTILNFKYVNMLGVVMGPSPFASLLNMQIKFPSRDYYWGGCNPWSAGILVPGSGGGASGTFLENNSVFAAYSVIRYFGAGGGLADDNVVRRCVGSGCYRFLSYPATQAYINNIYDCRPNCTVGISQVPGVANVFGGNWSAEQEGSPADVYSIANVSPISVGSGNGYWRLGDAYVGGASYQRISMDITPSIIGPNDILSNAFQDGRVGILNWFVIDTPSFGPVPFVADLDQPSVLSVVGAITPGSGYPPGVYHNVPLTGASGQSRLVDVTVGAGGGVTGVTVVNPGINYTVGDNLSTPNTNLGNAGSGFSVKAAQTLHLWVAPHFHGTFLEPNYVANTTLQAELQAATTIYASCPVFPFQCSVTAHGVFFENANTSMCLQSVGSGNSAPSVFYGGYLDADPAFPGWGPFDFGVGNPFQLAHWYAQRTLPYVWLTSDIIFDAFPWGNCGKSGGHYQEPLLIYSPANFEFINRNSATQGASNSAPLITYWRPNTNIGYSRSYRYGAGLEAGWRAEHATSIPAWKDTFSAAYQWATLEGKAPTSGIRPSTWTMPSLLPMDLTTLSNPQGLPPVLSMSLDGTVTNLQYPLVYGNTAYKTDVLSPAQLHTIDVLTPAAARQGTTIFEGSHDLYSYHQHLTAHDSGGPGIVLGMSWRARGHSWCVYMDDNTMSFMMSGLVIGLQTDALNYYIVTSVQPGLGLVTVYPLSLPGYSTSTGVSGDKNVNYTGTKIFMQPYRIRYLSSVPRYNSFSVSSAASAITAVAGEEIMADTSSGVWPLSLPLNPLQGDKVSWYDIGGAFATNNLIIDGNGSKINGSADSVAVTTSTPGAALYKDATTGWVTRATVTSVASLLVTPGDNVAFGGQIGSTIYPASFTYTLKASSGSGIAWNLTGCPAWLTPSASSGTATTSGSTITFTPAFGALAPGSNTATMTFTNMSNGQSAKRTVSFIVLGKQYLAEGDSITGIAATGGVDGYPGEYRAGAGASFTVSNFAVNGTLSNMFMRERRIDQIVGMKRPGDKYVFSCLIGMVDLQVGYTGGSQAAFLSQFAAYLDRRRASGWYVIACTLISANNPGNGAIPGGANDANIAPLNTEIRKWAGSTGIGGHPHADAICDFAASPLFDAGSYADLTYYSPDGVNPTPAGEHQLYLLIKPYVDSAFGIGSIGTCVGTSTAIGTPLVSRAAGTAAGTSTATGVLPVGTTFSPTDATAAGLTLTNGNLTISSPLANVWKSVRATTFRSSGLLYVEFKCIANPAASLQGWGLGDNAMPVNGLAGQPGMNNSCSTQPGVSSYGNGIFSPTSNPVNPAVLAINDVCQLAVNFTTKKVWFGLNNAWAGSGANPGTDTNPMFTFTGTPNLAFCFAIYDSTGGQFTVRPNVASQSFAPPTGFSSWD